MALDLGGTNFRVIKLVLQNGQIVEEVIDYFSVEESIRYNVSHIDYSKKLSNVI